MNKMNIYQRIHAVSDEIGTIAKRGKNKFHNYDYATEADFVHALRPLLKKYGLVIIPSVGKPTIQSIGEKGDMLATAEVQFTIVNIDNPSETAVATVLGQGTDKTDKAVYKLMTGAKKYFAALTFFVATGDDPEDDGPNPNRRSVSAKSKPAPSSNDEF